MNAMSMDGQAENALKRRRYLALWFPFLPVDRLRIARPDLWQAQGGAGPVVIVEAVRGAMRLVTPDADALALGLSAGMTLADARAQEPDLVSFEADHHADQDWLERLCDGCARYTPAGAVRGVREGDANVFRAIPYASPPVGERRWRPPAPMPPPCPGLFSTTTVCFSDCCSFSATVRPTTSVEPPGVNGTT